MTNLKSKDVIFTVIAQCFNHELFVEEAIRSIILQTYAPIQIIVIDDGSSDKSREILNELKNEFPFIELVFTPTNLGICAAFNLSLPLIKGKYCINLATDDVLFPDAVEQYVHFFELQYPNVGAMYANVELISESGEKKGTFYKEIKGEILPKTPTGNVFTNVLKSHSICSVSVVFRTAVLLELGGYNTDLVYEDYDILIRLSRKYDVNFIPKTLVKYRDVATSDSKKWYNPKENLHLQSTYLICKNTLPILQSEEEKKALAISIRYHARQSLFLSDYKLVKLFYALLKEMQLSNFFDEIIYFCSKCRINVRFLYFLYLKIRK